MNDTKSLTSKPYIDVESAPCFCGHLNGWDYSTIDRHQFPMTLRACERCGLLRTNPRPTAESLERFYREDFRKLYSPDGWLNRFEQQRQEGMKLRHLFPRARSVIDIGCGSGGTLKPFHDAGLQVWGCDLDEEYIHKAQEQMPNASMVVGDADALPPEAQADLVISVHTLEHRVDLREAVKQHADRMAPGDSMLYVEVPSIARVRNMYGSLGRYLCMPHLWHFTDRTLLYVLRSCGLRVECSWSGEAVATRAGVEEASTPPPDPLEASRVIAELAEYDRGARAQRELVKMLKLSVSV